MTTRRLLRVEITENLRLAWPIIGAQLLMMSMGTVDTIFAGRLSGAALAAVAVGSNLFFLGFVLFVGLFMALAAQLAQRRGAGDAPEQLGERIGGALGVALVSAGVWCAFVHLSIAPALAWLALSPEVSADVTTYLRIISLATFPLCALFALRNGCEGLGLTRIPLMVGVVGLAVNVAGDYALMYGRWGAPDLGVAGAAWASVLSALAMLASYVVAYRGHPQLHALRVGAQLPQSLGRHGGALLRLGLPVAAILTAEAWLFQLGALLVARFGDIAVAAHQVAISFAAMTFMVPLSIGMATTVRVGNAIGAGRPAEAALAGRVGIGLGATFALISAGLMLLVPAAIVAVYTRTPEVATLAVQFLAYAAVFQLFDCIQATSNGALRGLHDTRVPMLITVTAYWLVALPLAWWLSFSVGLGPLGVWWGFIVGLGIAALGLSLRFLRKTAA